MSKKYKKHFEQKENFNDKLPNVSGLMENRLEYKEPLPQLSFDSWFSKVATERKFNSNLKETIKIHFENNGFMENNNFDEGLKHFGF